MATAPKPKPNSPAAPPPAPPPPAGTPPPAPPQAPPPAPPAPPPPPAPPEPPPADPNAPPDNDPPSDDGQPSDEGDGGGDGEEGSPADDAVPETDDGYDLTIPDTGIKDHEGKPITFSIDPEDPVGKAFRKWAKDNNLPIKAVKSAMAEIYAPLLQASHESAVEAAKTRKSQALADLGGGNVEAGKAYAVRVLRSAAAAFPANDTTHDAGLKEALATPAAVKAIEALMNQLSAEGAGRTTPRDSEPAEDPRSRRARKLFTKTKVT